MKRVIAPSEYEVAPGDRSIFLAGGITNAPQWQDEMAELLEDTDLIVYDPRRKNYHDDVENQITWEFKKLRAADTVLFWFPYPAGCVITLFELGAWSMHGKNIFVGVDPKYSRRLDVLIQMRLAKPDLKIVPTLVELGDQVKRFFGYTR